MATSIGSLYAISRRTLKLSSRMPSLIAKSSSMSRSLSGASFGETGLCHQTTAQKNQVTHPNSLDPENQPRLVQAVPESLSLFQSRLATVWNGLMATEISYGWRNILAVMSAQEWQEYIAQNTPSHVQKLLGSPSAPTIFTLEALGRQEDSSSKCTVIRACILTPRRKLFLESECFVLLGSITNRKLGRWNWQRMRDKEVRFWLGRFFQFRLEKPLFSLMGNPIPLFQVPYEWETREEEGRSAALIRIARAIYTIWLRAVAPKVKPAIIGMAPWDGDCIRYRGMRKDMPLTEVPNKMESRPTRRWRRPEHRQP